MQQGKLIGSRLGLTEADSTPPADDEDGLDLVELCERGEEVPDQLSIVAVFDGGTTPTAVVQPWLYLPELETWVAGAKVLLKAYDAADYATGQICSVAGVGGASRVFIYLVELTGTPTSVDLHVLAQNQIRR